MGAHTISIIIIRNSLTLVCQYVPKNNTFTYIHVAFLKIFCAGSICCVDILNFQVSCLTLSNTLASTAVSGKVLRTV